MRLFGPAFGALVLSLFAARVRAFPRSPLRQSLRRVRIGRRATAAWSSSSDLEDVKRQIHWLPPLNASVKEAEASGLPDTTVMPIFPLGATAYCPDSPQVLNIFEPRYRKMYNDILMNGSRRFVVTMVNNEQAGQFAEVGVVFYLSELREVSEETEDRVKYICTHDVTDRVKIHGIVNPRAGVDRSTYMKAEVSILKDEDADADLTEPQGVLLDKVRAVVALQQELGEEVRFEEGVANTFDAGRSGDRGLWGLIELWKAYLGTRMAQKSQQMQRDVEGKLTDYLKELANKPGSPNMRQASFSLSDLPLSVRKEVQSMQQRLREEVMPMLDEQTLWVQLMLQATSHQERLEIFGKLVDTEARRLETRLSLKRMFGTPGGAPDLAEDFGIGGGEGGDDRT